MSDADALLSKIESIVENPAASSAPVAVSPINLSRIRASLKKAQRYIKRHSTEPNGIHPSVLAGSLLSAKVAAKKAARKAARTRKRNEEKRAKAAAKAARTRAEKAEKKRLAIIKGKRTRTINANKKAKAQRKRTRTIRRKHGRK